MIAHAERTIRALCPRWKSWQVERLWKPRASSWRSGECRSRHSRRRDCGVHGPFPAI